MVLILIIANALLGLLLLGGLWLIASGKTRRTGTALIEVAVEDLETSEPAEEPRELVPAEPDRDRAGDPDSTPLVSASLETPATAPVIDLRRPPLSPAPDATAPAQCGFEVAAGGTRPDRLLGAILDALSESELRVESFTDTRAYLAGPGRTAARLIVERAAGASPTHPAFRVVIDFDGPAPDRVAAALRNHLDELAPVLRVRTTRVEVHSNRSDDSVIVVDHLDAQSARQVSA